jgi:hypothetical protein
VAPIPELIDAEIRMRPNGSGAIEVRHALLVGARGFEPLTFSASRKAYATP